MDGNCLDMPNVPPHHAFPQKVKAKSYKVFERNGLIWTYMGRREIPPPLPSFEPVLLPEEQINVFFVQRQCNWLQALEGDIDTSHFGFLHVGGVMPDVVEDNLGRYAIINSAPEYHVADTDWGTMYAAYRPADAELDLLAVCALPLPLLDDAARRPVSRSHCRPRLGADGRHAHYVRASVLEEEHAGLAQDEGRQPDSRRRHGPPDAAE